MGGICAMGLTKEGMKKAVYWYSKGAEVGETNSMLALANGYRVGQLGLEKDEDKAKFWYGQITKAEEEKTWEPMLRSALAGNAAAMENLG